MKKSIHFLIQVCVLHVMVAQDFDHLPVLDGDLDRWYSSVAQNMESPIMQGTYYYRDEEQIISPEENPFYDEGWDRMGTVFFEGRQFKDMNIVYNTWKDLLLIKSWEMGKNGERSLLVNQAKIDSFTIHKRKFVHHRYVEIGSRGFYKKVMEGDKLTCYSKEIKTGTKDRDRLIIEFKENAKYYIKYREETYNCNRVSSLYKIFPEHKKDLKRYVKEISPTLPRDDERLFIAVLFYCDSIVI